ncbi:MAG TPA: helix-turn-helix domain-containing protein [Jatrophihabitantaceae bacterium]
MTASPRRRLAPEERAGEIVAVAARQFAAHGYSATSTSEIAEDAGVTRALVHHYFGDKPGLLRAVVEAFLVDVAKVPLAPLSLPLDQRIAVNTDHWLDFADAHRDWWIAGVNQGDALALPGVVDVTDRARSDYFRRLVRSYPDQLDGSEVERFAVLPYLALNQTACQHWLIGRTTREHTRLLLTDTLAHLLNAIIPALKATAA